VKGLSGIAATAAILLSGCHTQEAFRHEGVTAGAGNAIAANTVMQMVDPWPFGVQDTDLATPADLEQYRRREAAASEETSPGYTASE
jgi:hypothetical protein